MATAYDVEDTNAIVDIFQETYCRTWDRADIVTDKLVRFAQAYLLLAANKYRPQASGDGFGTVDLSPEQLLDKQRLRREAVDYAARFCREEDKREFWVGCSNYTTNRAFVLCIEAARVLAGGVEGDDLAIRLLESAVEEIRRARS